MTTIVNRLLGRDTSRAPSAPAPARPTEDVLRILDGSPLVHDIVDRHDAVVLEQRRTLAAELVIAEAERVAGTTEARQAADEVAARVPLARRALQEAEAAAQAASARALGVSMAADRRCEALRRRIAELAEPEIAEFRDWLNAERMAVMGRSVTEWTPGSPEVLRAAAVRIERSERVSEPNPFTGKTTVLSIDSNLPAIQRRREALTAALAVAIQLETAALSRAEVLERIAELRAGIPPVKGVSETTYLAPGVRA